MSRVYVVDYDPEWPARYERLRAALWPTLRAYVEDIQHVGSTAVPGLAAKPIIDVDVIVGIEEAIPLCVAALERAGYVHRGELGIPQRHAFHRPPQSDPHNLYVCLRGAASLRNHLRLRDHLRAHPEDAARYADLKRALAARHPEEIDAYVEGKTAFITEILARYDLSAEELEGIIASNRAR